ncbi:uncharacterized [Tachysurus ichikawai]
MLYMTPAFCPLAHHLDHSLIPGSQRERASEFGKHERFFTSAVFVSHAARFPRVLQFPSSHSSHGSSVVAHVQGKESFLLRLRGVKLL